MPIDFKARQIRTAQIIASGSNKTPIIIYNSGSALDYYGSYPATLLDDVGSDVFLFVSGGIGQKDTTNSLSISVFGGDVVISGTIYDGSGAPYSTGGGTPSLPFNAIQYNNAGSFGGNSNLTYVPASGLHLTGSFNIKGSITPDADFTYNLGTASKRWQNVYTGDLHLRNDRGDWTIVEEAEYLCVVNNLTGKRYKMMLSPLD